jgi:magnesium transporter
MTDPTSDGLAPLHELKFESAGEHHTRRVPTAGPGDSVGAVREALVGGRFDSVSVIAVCDCDGRLAGVAKVEDVLAADGRTLMGAIMDPSPPVVTPDVDQEIAAWEAIRRGETSLAVLDDGGHFCGFITPGRIVEVLLWEHDEDTARLGGFMESRSQAFTASDEPLLRRLGHRLPWLLLGLVGAILSADLVGAFEGQLQSHVILAFFIPGIVYLADAAGTQTETLVIRGMSLGIPVQKVFRRELLTGCLIGLALALVLYPVLVWRWGRADVAAAVSLAVFAACSIASAVAMALPWTLKYFRQDPAFAAGPLATVIQDLISVLVYLLVCTAIV